MTSRSIQNVSVDFDPPLKLTTVETLIRVLLFIGVPIVILFSICIAFLLCFKYCSRTGYTYNKLVQLISFLIRSYGELSERVNAYMNSSHVQESIHQVDHDENSPLIANNVPADVQNSVPADYLQDLDHQEDDVENSPLIENNVIADVHVGGSPSDSVPVNIQTADSSDPHELDYCTAYSGSS